MLRSILANFSARFAVALINFMVLLLTARMLGSDVRGEISVIALGMNIIHLISDIAGGPSLVYLVPRASNYTLLIIGYAWSFVSAIIIGIPLAYFELIPPAFATHILILSLLVSLHSVHLNMLLGRERNREYNMLLVTQAIVLILVMGIVIFAFGGKTTGVFIIGAYVAYGTVLLISTVMVWRVFKVRKIEQVAQALTGLFRNGFFTQVASLTHQLSVRISFYILAAIGTINFAGQMELNGDQAVGIYSIAISLAEAILLFSQSVATIVLSRTANANDQQYKRRLAVQCSKLSLVVTIPGIALFMLLPESFYVNLLGPDFLPVKQVFTFLTPGIALVSFGTVYSHYFSGTGKHFMNAISGTVALTITLLTAYVLIPGYGLVGASLAASLAYAGMVLTIFVLFLFERGFSPAETIRGFFSVADFALLKKQFDKLLGKNTTKE